MRLYLGQPKWKQFVAWFTGSINCDKLITWVVRNFTSKIPARGYLFRWKRLDSLFRCARCARCARCVFLLRARWLNWARACHFDSQVCFNEFSSISTICCGYFPSLDKGTIKVLMWIYKSYRCDENVQILKVRNFENVYEP